MKRRKLPGPKRFQQGFALVSAIFILVVLAALGGFVASISSFQQIGSAMDVQGVRAYEAARSGLEWGLYQVNVVNSHGSCAASSGSFTPAAPTLSGFTVTVSCTAVADTHGGPTIYTLSSFACNMPLAGACPNTGSTSGFYVERRVVVTF
jgi:MSHA biogenesis protein MshP